MACVLRVFGKGLDTEDLLSRTSLIPFRKDVNGKHAIKVKCLHYDVFQDDLDNFKDSLAVINKFIEKNKIYFDLLNNRSDIDGISIDIEVFLSEDILSKNIIVDNVTMNKLSELKISLSISIYKTSGEILC